MVGCSDRVLDWGFLALFNTRGGGDNGAVSVLGGGGAGISVEFEEACNVELWLLQYLDLADAHIVHRVHTLACFVDFFANGFHEQFVNEFLQVACASFTFNDFDHLGADQTNL